jgi:hypothetical protein
MLHGFPAMLWGFLCARQKVKKRGNGKTVTYGAIINIEKQSQLISSQSISDLKLTIKNNIYKTRSLTSLKSSVQFL